MTGNDGSDIRPSPATQEVVPPRDPIEGAPAPDGASGSAQPPISGVLDTPTQADPTVAAATAAGWRAWLTQLLTAGRARLAALGLVLSLGFGVGLVTLYLFAVLADTVVEGDTERLDFAVLYWLRERQSPALDGIAWFFSLLGSELVAVFLMLLLGLFTVRRRWGAGFALLLVTIGAQLQNNVLKDLFQRTRPAPVTGLIPAQAFSFPSGHAMVAAAFYAFIMYLSWRLLRGWLRVACVATLVVVVLLIGVSRLYLGVHYFTDVVAGYLAGFFWTNSVIIGGSLLARRRRTAGAASVAVPIEASAPGPSDTTSRPVVPTASQSQPSSANPTGAATTHSIGSLNSATSGPIETGEPGSPPAVAGPVGAARQGGQHDGA